MRARIPMCEVGGVERFEGGNTASSQGRHRGCRMVPTIVVVVSFAHSTNSLDINSDEGNINIFSGRALSGVSERRAIRLRRATPDSGKEVRDSALESARAGNARSNESCTKSREI